MLNEFRTLLLNVSGMTSATAPVAGELIDPLYRPVVLPPAIQAVRMLLFGPSPDLTFLNVRARQLLAVVHASPLVEFVVANDPRITYDFNDQSLVGPAAYQPAASPPDGLTVTGSLPPPDSTGKMSYTFDVTTPAPNQASIAWRAPALQNVLFEFVPGVRIVPAGLGLAFTLSRADAGQAWRVTALARPAIGPAGLLALLTTIGEPTLDGLFGFNTTEPDKTFRNIFFQSPETPLRLAAAVCAVVARTREAWIA